MTQRPAGPSEPERTTPGTPAGQTSATGQTAPTGETFMPRDSARIRQQLEIEDERWSRAHQMRVWMWLAVMIIGYCVWTLFVYFLEPGLR